MSLDIENIAKIMDQDISEGMTPDQFTDIEARKFDGAISDALHYMTKLREIYIDLVQDDVASDISIQKLRVNEDLKLYVDYLKRAVNDMESYLKGQQ